MKLCRIKFWSSLHCSVHYVAHCCIRWYVQLQYRCRIRFQMWCGKTVFFFAQSMNKLLASNIFPLSENQIWIREAVKVITGCFYCIWTESVFRFPFPKIILSFFVRHEGEEYVLNWIKTKPTALKDLRRKCLCLISHFEKIKVLGMV